MTSLYEIATSFREQLDDLFDPETGEALPEFDEFRVMLGNKANAVAAYVLNCESDAEQAKFAIKRIKALQTAHERKAEKLRDYLAENMKTAGIHEIKSADGSFVVKLYVDRDESVVIEDGAKFAPELCNDPKPPEPSKTKIKNAILAGEPVAGAYIVRKDRLTIK
tara:strand:- start:1229 stop:1723 length:495 start_codon:yes stop_codon:yes gene_type:complete